jgi:molecular chaperone HtpG
VRALESLREKDESDPRLAEWIEVLYDQALLTEGSSIDDPGRFARRINTLLAAAAESTLK